MSVTKDQLTEVAEKLFAEIDTNKNGKLEREEVRKFTQETMKIVKPNSDFNEDEFNANFETLDKNQDGSVSKQELFDSLMQKAKDAGALA